MNEKQQPPMNAKEAAMTLSLHLETVYRQAQQGELPAVRHGGRWIFNRARVNAIASGMPFNESDGKQVL